MDNNGVRFLASHQILAIGTRIHLWIWCRFIQVVACLGWESQMWLVRNVDNVLLNAEGYYKFKLWSLHSGCRFPAPAGSELCCQLHVAQQHEYHVTSPCLQWDWVRESNVWTFFCLSSSWGTTHQAAHRSLFKHLHTIFHPGCFPPANCCLKLGHWI